MNEKVVSSMKHQLLTLSLLSSLVLASCGGPSSEDSLGGRSGVPSGELTFSITDAAVDGATEVWVQFSAVEIKPADGPSITYTFDTPMNVDLLSLQGSVSEDFFKDIVVPSGTYNWVRLAVNTSGTSDSYIKFINDNNDYELTIPSGSQSGLKINNEFIVAAGGKTAMTIDFDLRKSIVEASGEYKLKPVLRLVNNAEAGTITGSIDSALTTGANCSDELPDTGNAVYVFTGFDAELDDIDNISPDPITTALMTFNTETGMYDYEVGFLPEGHYTVAYTCMADLDGPKVDDVIVFQSTTNVTVTAPVELAGADTNR
jgi:Domain of unknown function (DUF4382)